MLVITEFGNNNSVYFKNIKTGYEIVFNFEGHTDGVSQFTG